ncbi:MAG: hypothetical protein BGN86_12870 [Caulobacterales bacterium 68-7]|nr:hypothetical protein [Caulobacterales bacterium]OJU12503.1 MAG: hypothetical protein BGN86_12870 [Caulobacterales bacterium 68-7]
MFVVEALEQGFMGKRARLRALGADGSAEFVAAEDGAWANHLRTPLVEGQQVTVILPAKLKIEVGQALAIAG